MFVLVILIMIDGNPSVSMQEFTSTERCQNVGRGLATESKFKGLTWWCVAK